MKLIFPALLCLLLAACETVLPEPAPGTVEHQRWLHEQAREHFLAMKAQERARRGDSVQPRVAEERGGFQPAIKPAPAPSASDSARSKPVTKVSRPRGRARMDETFYEPTAEGLAERRAWEQRQAREYQAFEAREARRLGKTPAQLTARERAWIRASAR